LFLRNIFVIDNFFDIRKANPHGFDLWFCHLHFFSAFKTGLFPSETSAFCFWVILEDPKSYLLPVTFSPKDQVLPQSYWKVQANLFSHFVLTAEHTLSSYSYL
jgi:hypothetical protein